jgi:hypothetical protein
LEIQVYVENDDKYIMCTGRSNIIFILRSNEEILLGASNTICNYVTFEVSTAVTLLSVICLLVYLTPPPGRWKGSILSKRQ